MLFLIFIFFFFNDTATTEIYTLSLHDALPIYEVAAAYLAGIEALVRRGKSPRVPSVASFFLSRSEEHTSELQSQSNLVCRLLLEKKKNKYIYCMIFTYLYTCARLLSIASKSLS